MTITPPTAFLLFPTILLLLFFGHRLRRIYPKTSINKPIESAIFALLGLLLAFTFSGALSRYDEHRKLSLEEASDISTVYLRLDLLPPDSQPAMRQLLRDYASIRAHRFDEQSDTPQAHDTSRRSNLLHSEIWSRALAASTQPGANPDAAKLLLPAINSMIDIAATRKNAFDMHPPVSIFLLLFFLSGVCAFIAGFSMETSTHAWLYTGAFALSVTLTVYITLEVEYPRRGLIYFATQNEIFSDLLDSIK